MTDERETSDAQALNIAQRPLDVGTDRAAVEVREVR